MISMKKDKKDNIEKTASACSVSSEEIPEETLFFIRRYFLVEIEDPTPEELYRAELLAKTIIKIMIQFHRIGMDGEYQPVFVAANYVKQHTGNVTEFKRTYETISGKPYVTFNLAMLSQEYEKAYKAWFKETFGVEMSEDSAKIIQSWGGAVH